MSKKSRKGKLFFRLLIFAGIAAGALYLYGKYMKPVNLGSRNYTYVYIERSDNFDDLIDKSESAGVVIDPTAFRWLAEKMGLEKEIHPGKYRITNGMTMRQIINLFKYSKQEKVKLSYNAQIRDLGEFVTYTAGKLEMEEEEIEEFLYDDKKLRGYFGLDPDNAFALIVPGTYEISWAASPEELFGLLKNRYDKIWNAERKQKASNLGYTIPEVITLASIVQCESRIKSEQEKIAGVYMNRLRRNMPLQADPTLKFAGRNFEARRLLNEDKEINSPYNTYKYRGIPPGPICLVNIQSVDATLNYRKHSFLYFCAKPQLNGYSDFSKTYEEHCRYARSYQRNLDKIGISR